MLLLLNVPIVEKRAPLHSMSTSGYLKTQRTLRARRRERPNTKQNEKNRLTHPCKKDPAKTGLKGGRRFGFLAQDAVELLGLLFGDAFFWDFADFDPKKTVPELNGDVLPYSYFLARFGPKTLYANDAVVASALSQGAVFHQAAPF